MALASSRRIAVKHVQANSHPRRRICKFHSLNTIKRIDCSSRNVRYRQQARLINTKLVIRLNTIVNRDVVTSATNEDVRASATLEGEAGTSDETVIVSARDEPESTKPPLTSRLTSIGPSANSSVSMPSRGIDCTTSQCSLP